MLLNIFLLLQLTIFRPYHKCNIIINIQEFVKEEKQGHKFSIRTLGFNISETKHKSGLM